MSYALSSLADITAKGAEYTGFVQHKQQLPLTKIFLQISTTLQSLKSKYEFT